jgi:hypothetical protein
MEFPVTETERAQSEFCQFLLKPINGRRHSVSSQLKPFRYEKKAPHATTRPICAIKKIFKYLKKGTTFPLLVQEVIIGYLSRCFFERCHHLKHSRASPSAQIISCTSCITEHDQKLGKKEKGKKINLSKKGGKKKKHAREPDM